MPATAAAAGVDYDLVIVGAGMFGSSAAKYARRLRPNLRVAIIGPDNNTTALVRGQHFDEARITRLADPVPDQLRLNYHALHSYAETERESGISFYTPCGLVWGMATAEAAEAVARLSAADPARVPPADAFSRKDRAAVEREAFSGELNLESLEAEVAGSGAGVFYVERGAAAGAAAALGGTVHPTRYVQAQLRIAATTAPADHFVHITETVTAITEEKEKQGEGRVVLTLTSGGEAGRPQTVTAARVLVAAASFSFYLNLLPERLKGLTTPEPEFVVLLRVRPPHEEGEGGAGTAAHERNAAESLRAPAVVLTVDSATGIGFYCLPPRYYADKKGWFIKVGPTNQHMATGAQPQHGARVESHAGAMEWYSGSVTVPAAARAPLESAVSRLYRRWEVLPETPEDKASLDPKNTTSSGGAADHTRRNRIPVHCIWDRTKSGGPVIDRTAPGSRVWCALGGNGRGAKNCDTIGRIAAHRALEVPLGAELSEFEGLYRLDAS